MPEKSRGWSSRSFKTLNILKMSLDILISQVIAPGLVLFLLNSAPLIRLLKELLLKLLVESQK